MFSNRFNSAIAFPHERPLLMPAASDLLLQLVEFAFLTGGRVSFWIALDLLVGGSTLSWAFFPSGGFTRPWMVRSMLSFSISMSSISATRRQPVDWDRRCPAVPAFSSMVNCRLAPTVSASLPGFGPGGRRRSSSPRNSGFWLSFTYCSNSEVTREISASSCGPPSTFVMGSPLPPNGRSLLLH